MSMLLMFAKGGVLSQKDEKGHDWPIYFACQQLAIIEKNYIVTKREGLRMIFSIQNFRHNLLGYKFVFHLDHDVLKYMINIPQNSKIARWVLLFQKFNFTIQVTLKKTYANVDHFSQIKQDS